MGGGWVRPPVYGDLGAGGEAGREGWSAAGLLRFRGTHEQTITELLMWNDGASVNKVKMKHVLIRSRPAPNIGCFVSTAREEDVVNYNSGLVHPGGPSLPRVFQSSSGKNRNIIKTTMSKTMQMWLSLLCLVTGALNVNNVIHFWSWSGFLMRTEQSEGPAENARVWPSRLASFSCVCW